jgi:hypothetical protein
VVDSVSPNAIGVRPVGKSGPAVVYQVARNATITRNLTPAALATIVPGDTVELKLDATDKARVVAAKPRPSVLLTAARTWWWTGFAPIFLLGLIVRARTREPFLLMAAPGKGSERRGATE